MIFLNYQKLSQRERALADGKLITYHFYVGGLTLLILGFYGTVQGEYSSWIEGFFPWVGVFFGFASLIAGLGLQLLHRHMIAGPQRDAYLATVTAVLGRHQLPFLPLLLGVLIVFSVLVTILYILAS
jgi:hypothetical protein